MQCNKLDCLPAISGHLIEVNLTNFGKIAHAKTDQSKDWSDIVSCTRSRTSGSSCLAFPNLMQARAIILQAALSHK